MMSSQEIRDAISKALPAGTSNDDGELTKDARWVYVPPSHIKALRLESNLVIGGRGVGKTFWSNALTNPAIRQALGKDVPDLSHVDVKAGFSLTPSNQQYPDAEVFSSLLSQGFSPADVWRAIVARCLCCELNKSEMGGRWSECTAWLKNDPEFFSMLLEEAEQHYAQRGSAILIVFDALDRTSNEWQKVDAIVRGLLQLVLQLKRYPHLHTKVFLREDQFRRKVTDFTDASKILATRVELTWASYDLHGLIWQYFCNASDSSGKVLREIYRSVVGNEPEKLPNGVWQLDAKVKKNEDIQRQLFIQIAGNWMGRDRRRGVPYTWSVGHLADTRGLTSPRSFLCALRSAADDSRLHHAEHGIPLHYDSIKRGVLAASEIRVKEMAEDYPWVETYMQPLRGITVPCPFEAIEQAWSNVTMPDSTASLPPENVTEGAQGVFADMKGLGIFETMKDGRVNMPDLYRVGFGLGRRGGVKPAKKSSDD
ncbi:hypothetical protein QZQ15_18295 [Serratia marcescens]|uniref:hypothetical protein n=1 Tax=Serratia marcescens TaxID=615 RepID=UPI0027919F5E|nr:hypothetical protein [Serratia marcescens]MDP8799946.1 hypothetical protein [Serratia marcescens]